MLGNKNFQQNESLEEVRKLRLVFVGGGHGLSAIIHEFRLMRQFNITAIVTVFDNGGDSKRMREAYGILPPGDICSTLVALCDHAQMIEADKIFSHRFPKNDPRFPNVSTKNFLFLTCYDMSNKDFMGAINSMSRFLRVQGKVLPVTLDYAHLEAIWSDGRMTSDEGQVDEQSADAHIEYVRLNPSYTRIYHEAEEAIGEADYIIVCPGSLQTSIIATTLPKGFREAILNSPAKLLMVTNLVTDPRENPELPASRAVKKVLRAMGRNRLDAVFCNNGTISADLQKKYAAKGSYPVICDQFYLSGYALEIVTGRFVDERDGSIRHNPLTAEAIRDFCVRDSPVSSIF